MISDNIKRLQEQINKTCEECGRSSNDLTLVAVSKFFGIESIQQAKESGINNFGENRAQELALKFEKIGDSVIWHFIGTLQKNKVKYAVRCAKFIHSIDSLDLLLEVNKKAESIGKIQKVLFEVKTSYEDTKSGIESEEEVFRLAEESKKLNNIEVIGLMTISPLTEDEKLIRKSFSYLRNLREKLIKSGYTFRELSMGMTSDFKIAIEEGSTILRIGSAIFGQRDYKKDWRQI
ncbi:MAG: YggS family pyridoxal phosphate-dependent enzyme [Ignavibacterium sp.]|nr:YggS family pyridoxal phosphate-dependent enzyme [Ignavibacterium sp.]MDW8374666.1 YggS family pyridoxal phosphate-dependent enzyme [Ignavibacteriales bacterium]